MGEMGIDWFDKHEDWVLSVGSAPRRRSLAPARASHVVIARLASPTLSQVRHLLDRGIMRWKKGAPIRSWFLKDLNLI
jgi:hypothetical protein